MTIWIKRDSDREGRAVCQILLQGGIHNETPTDKKNLFGREPSWEPSGPPRPPPPLKGRIEGDNKVPRK